MRKLFYFIPLFILFSCDKEADIDIVQYEPKVVVEGIIENDDYASVLLSVSASMTGPKDTLSLLSHVIKSAKVTVSDGENDDVLILQPNKNKIPPYEYRGRSIKGEVGKTYKLKIEYNGEIITSTTYIPKPVELDSIWFKKGHPEDTIGYLNVIFKNVTEHYYQIATRNIYMEEEHFIPCLYGNIDPKVYPKDKKISMQINKGPILFPKTDFTTYFKSGHLIRIRFCTQTEDAYKFWTSYQNEVLNSQNPLFPANTSLYSNISGDAIGIWSGIGSYKYLILAK